MNNPLISIVIPTFDRPFFLKRAIKSVLKQDYKKIEIIIVVDGYSENTLNLIEDINQNNNIMIKLIQTYEKVGGSEARNIGAREANGELIALLDDDDEWFSDKLSSQLSLLGEKQLTVNDDFLCFTSLKRYKEIDQKIYDQLPNINYKDSRKKSIASYLFETKGLRNIGFIQTSTVVVPKRLLLETPFTEGLVKHQDWDWLLNLDKNHTLSIIQVEEAKIIYHSDVPKDSRVGYINRWKFTEKWGMDHRDSFTKLAYESFLLNYILLGIASDTSLTKKERRVEIINRFKKLSLRTKLRPYTWKMVVYMVLEK